jgi:hypothetical protein
LAAVPEAIKEAIKVRLAATAAAIDFMFLPPDCF